MKRGKRGRDRKSSLKHSLNLTDLDQAKPAVLNSLQFLLEHVSVQTTNHIGVEPAE